MELKKSLELKKKKKGVSLSIVVIIAVDQRQSISPFNRQVLMLHICNLYSLIFYITLLLDLNFRG